MRVETNMRGFLKALTDRSALVAIDRNVGDAEGIQYNSWLSVFNRATDPKIGVVSP